MNIFIQLILGIPIAAILYALLEPFIGRLELDAIYKISVGAIAYAVFFEAVCKIFEKAFFDKLRKGHKRCELIICTAVSSSAYEESEVIAKKKTFEACYSLIKNNGEMIKPRQFFKISELNWNGKKEVDSWRYYRNGDFIRESDEELCKKICI